MKCYICRNYQLTLSTTLPIGNHVVTQNSHRYNIVLY